MRLAFNKNASHMVNLAVCLKFIAFEGPEGTPEGLGDEALEVSDRGHMGLRVARSTRGGPYGVNSRLRVPEAGA